MNWKNLISTVAPWIGTALGGPLSGMAVKAVASALGLSEQTEKAIQSAIIGATPEQVLAIKRADQDFALQMQELGFQNVQALEKIAADDRSSARQREMSVRDNTPRVLAYAYTLGYFIILIAIVKFGIPAEVKDTIMTLLGILSTVQVGITTYYFGSSAGSSRKTEIMSQSIK